MSNLSFPIIEVNDHKLISRSGEESSFYKILSPDLEQMTEQEVGNFYDSLCNQICSCSTNYFYKFYYLNGENFLNTNDLSFNIPNSTLLPKNNPLEIFFKNSDIYSNITFHDDYLSFNGKYLRILSVREFSPAEGTFDHLPKDIDFLLSFKRKDNKKSLKELDQTRSAHMSNFFKNKRDIESEGAYNQAEELLIEITNSTDALFDMEVFFIVTEFSLEALNNKVMQLISIMQQKGNKLFIEGNSVKKKKSGFSSIFNSLIPGVKPLFNLRGHIDKGGHLVTLLPMGRSFIQANVLNDENNQAVHFLDINGNDLFFNPFSKELKNRNMLVSGSTGGGKSVFVNYLLHHLLQNNNRGLLDIKAVILDKKASYKRLCLYHGGNIIERGFNPLQFKDPIFLREIIISVCGSENFTKLERGKLLKSIKIILQKNPEIVDFNKFLLLLEESNENKDFKNLSLYFEEVSEFFITDNIYESDITYIDFENYPKGVISPLIIFILQFFKEIKTKEKILVFDECWAYLKDHVQYVEECFRTFRKTGAFPIAISQGLLDFNKTDQHLSNAIVNNSHLKVFFPQDYMDVHEVSKFDNDRISELCFEKDYFSECYLKSSDNTIRKTMVIELSSLEKELFHTEAQSSDPMLEFIKENKKYFKSNKEIIDSFVRLRHG